MNYSSSASSSDTDDDDDDDDDDYSDEEDAEYGLQDEEDEEDRPHKDSSIRIEMASLSLRETGSKSKRKLLERGSKVKAKKEGWQKPHVGRVHAWWV